MENVITCTVETAGDKLKVLDREIEYLRLLTDNKVRENRRVNLLGAPKDLHLLLIGELKKRMAMRELIDVRLKAHMASSWFTVDMRELGVPDDGKPEAGEL